MWDNGSSDDIKEFLNSCDFYDDIHFSSRNLFDNGAFAALRKKAHELGCEYITFIEDDCELFDSKALLPAIEFLDNNPDCGYLRLLKFETSRIHIYDKFKNHPKKDVGNAQRLFNTITKENLRWEKCENISGYQFFKNNWHWTQFPGICRLSVLDDIIPKSSTKPMQGHELHMMKAYQELGLKTAVIDGGAITHLQSGYGVLESSRTRAERDDMNILNKTIDISEIEKEINEWSKNE